LPYESPLPDFVLFLLALLGQHHVDSPLSDPAFPPPIDPGAPTPLIYAAKENTEGYAVRFLVEHRGANPYLRDSEGHDALYYAMHQIERKLDVRAERSARQEWYSVDEEEELVAYEENIFAALAGPSDPVRYEAMFPKTVARLRQTAARQHFLRHSRGAVGHTHPLHPSAASVRMMQSLLKRSAGSDGLHCSSRSVRPRV
jgi:hypothetical protein